MNKTETEKWSGPMRNLLYRPDFWDPASEGMDKGELTHLPTDL